jgi:hypothetical protein
MYRQYDEEQDENDVREPQNTAGMYGQMPYDGNEQYEPQPMPWQGMQGMQGMPGMQTQIDGRPMICYPMMYGSQMGQYGTQESTDMYRQHGMNYYHRPRPYYRPRPYFYRPRPYFNIFPFFIPYYYPNYPYYYDYDEYGY